MSGRQRLKGVGVRDQVLQEPWGVARAWDFLLDLMKVPGEFQAGD